jgi:uncharacterized protein (TIGR02217 family)
MAFDEVQFPPNLALGATGGPKFKTSIVVLAAGHEQRNSQWSIARGEWDVGHVPRSKADMETLIDFFVARAGQARGFRFKDWADYTMARQTIGTGTAEADETTWQIFKRYTSGSENYDRVLTKIVAASVSVWINSVAQTEGVDFTLDYNTGIITTTSDVPDGHLVEVACEFDIPARFAMDHMQYRLLEPELVDWASIKIVEIRDIA